MWAEMLLVIPETYKIYLEMIRANMQRNLAFWPKRRSSIKQSILSTAARWKTFRALKDVNSNPSAVISMILSAYSYQVILRTAILRNRYQS